MKQFRDRFLDSVESYDAMVDGIYTKVCTELYEKLLTIIIVNDEIYDSESSRTHKQIKLEIIHDFNVNNL